MKTIVSILIYFIILPSYSNSTFDSSKANDDIQEFAQKIKAMHREQAIKDFEHHYAITKKLQLSLKFFDDLENMMRQKELVKSVISTTC